MPLVVPQKPVWNTFASRDPSLYVMAGQSVRVSTLDSRGRDADMCEVGTSPNPLCGPIYLRGASPGDTLVVHVDEIVPNRVQGYSYDTVAESVVDPEFVRQLPERQLVRWQIDPERNLARSRPEGSQAIEVPLRPMLGCLGVAPLGHQAISSATSGRHGGNMDYVGYVSGVTAYLPVFVPGALLYLGDGHAAQGDGEIVGMGIETSMDVTLRLDLIEKGGAAWPRGENHAEIFTIGNARPLAEALQRGTTEMLRWLTGDYGLSMRTAGALLGQGVRYDVGNVFDPAYTVACKLDKALFPRRRELRERMIP